MRDMGGAQVHVVILAAGRGSRLGAVAESTPKWLLDVGGSTIADRHLAAVAHPARSNGSGPAASAGGGGGPARAPNQRGPRPRGGPPRPVGANPPDPPVEKTDSPSVWPP